MDYARLGHSGLKVSRLCLGTMMFGRWGNTDHDDCVRIIHRALDEGVNFIDTANRYGMGESEEIVGKALDGRRDEVVLATKVFMPGPGGVLDRGTSRRHIILQVEESLRRLRTDWIDLYQIHRNDKDTPLEETLGALTDLVRQGKVRYLGVSTGTLAESRSMQFGGLAHGRVALDQRAARARALRLDAAAVLDLLARGGARDLPGLRALGFGAIVWSPLEGGWLAGRYRKGQPVPEDSRAAQRDRVRHVRAPQLRHDDARRRSAGSTSSRSWCGMADELDVPLARYAHGLDAAPPGGDLGDRRRARDAPPRGQRCAALDVRIPDEHRARDRRAGRAGHERLTERPRRAPGGLPPSARRK